MKPNEEQPREQIDNRNRPTGDPDNKVFRHDLGI